MPFYVCPIIGTGTYLDPYRPAVADQRVDRTAEIPTDDAGKPINTHCVVEVAAETRRTKLDADGKPVLDGQGNRIIETVTDAEALKATGTEAVVSKEAGRLAVKAKASGDVRI